MAEKLYTQAQLEELLEQAHEAGAVIAGEQLLKSLTEGGDFAVDSPLAKVKKRVEELLREKCKPLIDVLRDAPPPANISSPHGQILELDNAMFHKAYFDWYKKRIAELEKARASKGKQ